MECNDCRRLFADVEAAIHAHLAVIGTASERVRDASDAEFDALHTSVRQAALREFEALLRYQNHAAMHGCLIAEAAPGFMK